VTIFGAHTIIYSRDAEADRAFMRDVFGFESVDAGDGWLIFRLPPAEMALHPDEAGDRHELYLLCDDIEAIASDLSARGADVVLPVVDVRWGRLITVQLPGGGRPGVYQAKHPLAITEG
jgi:catechol 2,3-dioxygenase-like lactoylglutathione lyase family enzyme